MKKALRETQTLRAGCSKAGAKNVLPPQTPFSGARDGQNLTIWRWSLPSPTNPVWSGSMHAISSFHGNRPTNKQTNKPTNKDTRRQTGPTTILCAANLSAQCKNVTFYGVGIITYSDPSHIFRGRGQESRPQPPRSTPLMSSRVIMCSLMPTMFARWQTSAQVRRSWGLGS